MLGDNVSQSNTLNPLYLFHSIFALSLLKSLPLCRQHPWNYLTIPRLQVLDAV